MKGRPWIHMIAVILAISFAFGLSACNTTEARASPAVAEKAYQSSAVADTLDTAVTVDNVTTADIQQLRGSPTLRNQAQARTEKSVLKRPMSMAATAVDLEKYGRYDTLEPPLRYSRPCPLRKPIDKKELLALAIGTNRARESI